MGILRRSLAALVAVVHQAALDASTLAAIDAQARQGQDRREVCMNPCPDGMESLQYMAKAMIKLLDEHYLASAAIPLADLEKYAEDRSLLVAVDKSKGVVYFRVCDSLEAVEQMDRLRKFTEGKHS